jgi:hypothetical protein
MVPLISALSLLNSINFCPNPAQFDEAPVVQNLDVSAVQRHMQSAKPIVSTAASTIDTVWPVLENGYHAVEDVYVKLQPYKPELLAPVILGLFLVFFGMRNLMYEGSHPRIIEPKFIRLR